MRTYVFFLLIAFSLAGFAQERLLQPLNLMQMEHQSLSEFASPHLYPSTLNHQMRFSVLCSHTRPLQLINMQYNNLSLLSTKADHHQLSRGFSLKNAGFGPYQEWLLSVFAARNFGKPIRAALLFSHGSARTTAYQPFRIWQVNPEINFSKNQWQFLFSYQQWFEMQPNFIRFRGFTKLMAEKKVNPQLWITAALMNGKMLQSSITFKKSEQVSIRITANNKAHFGVAVIGKASQNLFYHFHFFTGNQGLFLQNHFSYAR